MQLYHVYVQFSAAGFNELGLPYSIEPRKWQSLLLDRAIDPVRLGINRPITAFGYSEWPVSMNLRVSLDPSCLAEELEYLKVRITGAIAVNIFIPLDCTPRLKVIPTEITQFAWHTAAA